MHGPNRILLKLLVTTSLLLIFVGCKRTDDSKSSRLQAQDSSATSSQSLPSRVQSYKDTLLDRKAMPMKDAPQFSSTELTEFQRDYLTQLLKRGEGEFEEDTAYRINQITNYVIHRSDTVFYAKGEFLPSEVDFHFYGAYNATRNTGNIYHLPIETYLSFTRYQRSTNYLSVYGHMGDNHSDDEGEVLLVRLEY